MRLQEASSRMQLELETLPYEQPKLFVWLAVAEQQWWRLSSTEGVAHRLTEDMRHQLGQLSRVMGLLSTSLRRTTSLMGWLEGGRSFETRVAIRVLTQHQQVELLPKLEGAAVFAQSGAERGGIMGSLVSAPRSRTPDTECVE